MSRLSTIFLVLGAASMPAAAAVSVETATGDWSKLPALSQRGYNHLSEKMEAKLFEIAESKQCPSFGLKEGRLDLSISFATQYSADGTLQKLVIPKLDCAQAESVLGGALLEMLQASDYAPTGKSEAGWYQGGLTFSFAGAAARDPGVPQAQQHENVALNVADPNQIVCEKIVEIGSRLATKRICMSGAQWAERRQLDRIEVEHAQQRRCNGEGAGQC